MRLEQHVIVIATFASEQASKAPQFACTDRLGDHGSPQHHRPLPRRADSTAGRVWMREIPNRAKILPLMDLRRPGPDGAAMRDQHWGRGGSDDGWLVHASAP